MVPFEAWSEDEVAKEASPSLPLDIAVPGLEVLRQAALKPRPPPDMDEVEDAEGIITGPRPMWLPSPPEIRGLTTGLIVALPTPLPVILPFVLDPDPESAPGKHDVEPATGLVKLLLPAGLAPPTLGETEDWWALSCK